MTIAIESLLFLLGGIVLAVVLTRVFGRPAETQGRAETSGVKLVRSPRTADGREETRLLVNDRIILIASNDGIRLADYTDEVDQLEAIAERVAAALGVGVEFARTTLRPTEADEGLAVRDLPRTSDEEIEERSRPKSLTKGQGGL
jgi:hypothetical protein